MCRASFSDKVSARRGTLVPSATISPLLPKIFANILPRYVNHSHCTYPARTTTISLFMACTSLLVKKDYRLVGLTHIIFIFPQGNCKFGPKCANIHILPDGRRINYGKNGVTFSTPSHRLPYTSGPSNLTTTFTTGHEMPLYGPSTPGYGGYSHLATSDEAYHTVGRQPSFDSGIPIIGTTPAYSPNGSAYGSPRDGDTRFDIGHSSVNKGLSAMDAPSLLRLTQMAVLMQLCIPTVLFPLPCPANLVLHRPRRTHPHEVTKPLRLYKCQLTLLVIT